MYNNYTKNDGLSSLYAIIYLNFVTCLTLDFPAGKLVEVLVGFRNKGSKDFIVQTMDASFRYPQDYSYYIQNVRLFKSFRINCISF